MSTRAGCNIYKMARRKVSKGSRSGANGLVFLAGNVYEGVVMGQHRFAYVSPLYVR